MLALELQSGETMKARAIIAGASYSPEMLKLITGAFDAAWAEIATHFDGDPLRETVRERLAHAILAAAATAGHDVEGLKRSALQVMALNYPLPPDVKQQ
jgi:hypothetical protein